MSLFSGCGGMDLGFSEAGLAVNEAYDSDPIAIETYNKNSNSIGFIKEIDGRYQITDPVDVIIATPPCQGFSTAGGYQKKDPRNSLFITASNIIASSRPNLAVLENVAAITNAKNKPLLDKAIQILKNAGYHVELCILNSEDFCVPQRRKRAFIVARSNNRLFDFSNLKPSTRKINVKMALTGISPEADAHEIVFPERNSKHAIISNYIKPGQKLCNVRASEACVHTWEIPEVFGRTTNKEVDVLRAIQRLRRRNRVRSYGDADPVEQETIDTYFKKSTKKEVLNLHAKRYLRFIGDKVDLSNTFNGKYRRLDPNGMSPTVDTRFGDIRLFLHPWENRGLTAREAARLQGFPDWFLFKGNNQTRLRQIGNAVPPPLAKQIAQVVRDLI